MTDPAGECVTLTAGDAAYPPGLELLGTDAPASLLARGSPALLRQPLLALFCSVRVPPDLVLPTYDLVRGLRESDVPVIGGFQAPLEREALDFLLRGRQPVVICPARGIEQMRVPRPWRQPLQAGRLLLVSPFPARLRRPTGRVAEARNRLVAALAASLLVIHAAPGGRAHRLARQALDWGKPVLTLDVPANADLLLRGARPLDLAGLRDGVTG